jgi:hypothetical protein
MTKKNLFILIGIGILIVALIIFFFIEKLGNGNNDTQTTSQPPATLPTSSSTPPATLPTTTMDNQQNIQNIEKKIENVSNSPVSQQAVKQGIDSVDLKDVQGKKIPLNDFKKATKISINDELSSYLDSKDYDMYYCPTESNKKDYAVYFGYNVSKAYGNLYPDTLTWMKNWEKTMLQDLHAVLFPEINFSDAELSQSLKFKDGKFRYASIQFPGEKTGSINYHISDNGVMVSSSPSCIEEMIKIYEPLQP